MARITNNADISLSLAVWLIHDNYDYVNMPNYISVTTLMKPIKQIVLAYRIPPEDQKQDVEEFIARALGNSIHDSIEKAWLEGHARSLKLLGFPDDLIARVRINPDPASLGPDDVPVYLEQRAFREFQGYTIGGKFDLVAEGHVEDNKSTSAFGWVYGTRDDEHRLQGSLYRWIDAAQPHQKITEDYMRVNYIFTDWQKSSARSNPKYPQKRVEYKDISLHPVSDMDIWVANKLNQIKRYLNVPEEQIPECTDEELWRSEPQYKYYSDPAKAKDPNARSTKNFTSLVEANQHAAAQGKGVVITKPGEVKRCGYCAAFDVCKQKDRYINQ